MTASKTTMISLEDKIRQVILSNLGREKSNNQGIQKPIMMKPNKIRKIVCKEMKETSWTQFQNVLDDLINRKIITKTTTHESGEMIYITASSSESFGLAKTKEKARGKKHNGDEQIETNQNRNAHYDDNNDNDKTMQDLQKQVVIKIPSVIAQYLTRKGGRKKKNIETNSKTKLTLQEVKQQQQHEEKDPVVNLTIVAKYEGNEKRRKINNHSNKEDDDNGNGGDKEKNAVEIIALLKRRIRVVTVIISSMIRSYKKNPDHFHHRGSGGGTLKEQEEAKRNKLELVKASFRNKKRRRMGGDNDNNSEKMTAITEGQPEDHQGQKRKKARKFY